MHQKATSYAKIKYFRESGRIPTKLHFRKALRDGKDVLIDFPIGDPKRIEGMLFQDKYMFFYKYHVYKHTEAQISKKLSISKAYF